MTNLQAFLHGFPRWLRSALKAAGMRQKDLSDATGITKGHICNIVHGRCSPSIDTVARIVDALVEKADVKEAE